LTVAVVVGFTALAAAEPADVDKIERARESAIDDRYQPELPRYDTLDAIACARDPNCRMSLGVGGGQGSGGAKQGSAGDPNAHPGSDGAVPLRPHRRAGGDLGEGPDRDRRTVDTREQPSEGGASGLMAMVMWGIIIVIAALLVFWVVSELFKRGDEQLAPAPGESQMRMQAAVDQIIDRPLGDADELARRGEYAEAIHTLLLRTLQELVKSAAVRVAPAMTSREILSRVPLLADARDALAGLITAVEITHFGDEPANAADYERCRQQFHVFATAFRASTARGGAQARAAA